MVKFVFSGVMMLFRRPPRKPNIPLVLAVTGLLGVVLVVYQSYSGLYPVIEIEDPLDFDVPVSRGRCFESVKEDGGTAMGRPFSQEAMEKVHFLEEIKDSAITTFTVR